MNRRIFENYNYINSGIFVIDDEDNIVFWNNVLENQSNIPSEKIVGENLFEVFPHLNKNYYRALIGGVMIGGPPTIFSYKLHKCFIPSYTGTRNERVQNTTLAGLKHPGDGKTYGVFSIQDITHESLQIEKFKVMKDKALHEVQERIRAEKKLKDIVIELENNKSFLEEQTYNLRVANEQLAISEKKLQTLNASKDKFFSIIGHDLRSPLNALLGYSELIEEFYHDLSDEEKKEYVANIRDVSKRMNELLMNLLNWARIQSGRMDFSPEKLNLSILTGEVLELLKFNASEKEIVIENNTGTGFKVFADKNMVETILRNLLSNAVKFTHPGGNISISAELRNEEVKISVGDDGTGMSEESVNKLFVIDNKVRSKGTKDEEGTGLGLILSKELVEKNGGEITVESTPGKGSIFSFSLPAG